MSVPVYCINLQERPDRKIHSQTQFRNLNLFTNVIYPTFYKDRRGGVYGCYHSHVKIWQDFFTKYPNQPFCIIFEDDFVVHENTRTTIKKAIRFMQRNTLSVDILHLHNWGVTQPHKHNNTWFSSGYGVSTVAYCITRSYIQKLIRNNVIFEPNGKHIDLELSLNANSRIFSTRVFYTNHTCITQSDSKTDNHLNFVDKILDFDRNILMESAIKFGELLRATGMDHSYIKIFMYNCIYLVIS